MELHFFFFLNEVRAFYQKLKYETETYCLICIVFTCHACESLSKMNFKSLTSIHILTVYPCHGNDGGAARAHHRAPSIGWQFNFKNILFFFLEN